MTGWISAQSMVVINTVDMMSDATQTIVKVIKFVDKFFSETKINK
jgi:hypothetical protein